MPWPTRRPPRRHRGRSRGRRSACASGLRSALEDVAEAVDLDAEVMQPFDGPLDGSYLTAELAQHPADLLLDAGPADVGHDVELAHDAGDDRLADQVLRECELDPGVALRHRLSAPFKLPERRPSR